MFVNGAREWMGLDARTFLLAKTIVEQKLLALDYNYFFGGIVSKRSVYEEHFPILGENFKNIFIDFSYGDTAYILAPEYTFRVYEYLCRHRFPEDLRKIFYSQEMIRNETPKDLQCGKTFAFWQIGYELFGHNDRALSLEAVTTLWKCLDSLPLKGLRFRISDKRILESLCNQYSMVDKPGLPALIEACNEDGDLFYDRYAQKGGNREFAEALKHLLNLASSRRLTFETIKDIVKDQEAWEAIADLENIYTSLEKLCGSEAIVIVPCMAKTWEAYTTFIYDARVDGYDKAIAGGGNLFIDVTNPDCIHSGAGIGVSRITEYLISSGQNKNLPNISYSFDSKG